MTSPDRPCSPADLTLVEFLRARLDEDERGARDLLDRTPHRWQRATDVGDWHNYAVVTAGNSAFGQDEPIAECGVEHEWGIETAEHIARHDPARILADVAAKRRIVELHAHGGGDKPHECPRWQWRDPDYPDDPAETTTGYVSECPTLRLLAEVYADHPDYREEWTP